VITAALCEHLRKQWLHRGIDCIPIDTRPTLTTLTTKHPAFQRQHREKRFLLDRKRNRHLFVLRLHLRFFWLRNGVNSDRRPCDPIGGSSSDTLSRALDACVWPRSPGHISKRCLTRCEQMVLGSGAHRSPTPLRSPLSRITSSPTRTSIHFPPWRPQNRETRYDGVG